MSEIPACPVCGCLLFIGVDEGECPVCTFGAKELADAPLFGAPLRGDEPLPEAPEPFRIVDDEVPE